MPILIKPMLSEPITSKESSFLSPRAPDRGIPKEFTITKQHGHEIWNLAIFSAKVWKVNKNGRTASMRCIKYKSVKSYVPGSKLLILRDDQPTFKKGSSVEFPLFLRSQPPVAPADLRSG